MTVEHGDDAAVGRQVREQPFGVGAGVQEAALAGALRGGPARVQVDPPR